MAGGGLPAQAALDLCDLSLVAEHEADDARSIKNGTLCRPNGDKRQVCRRSAAA